MTNQERDEKIFKLRKAGLKIKDIASQLGVSLPLVYKVLRKLRKADPENAVLQLRKTRTVSSKIESARYLLENGVSPEKVARDLGVTVATVYNWNRNHLHIDLKPHIYPRQQVKTDAANSALRNRIIDTYNKNPTQSVREIAEVVGVSHTTVWYHLKKTKVVLAQREKSLN